MSRYGRQGVREGRDVKGRMVGCEGGCVGV